MSEPFWSALQLTKDGFLMIPEKFDQPPLLISAEALWLKFHPHLTQVSFDEPPTIVKSGERKYISDMCNIISPILDDIDKMKDTERFRSPEANRQRREAMKNFSRMDVNVKLLERQQEAFQGRESSKDHYHSSEDASLVVCKTLNSIRLLFPLLVRILHHPLRADKELVISTRRLDQGTRIWLLGDYVCCIVFPKSLKSLEFRMKLILRSFISKATSEKVLAGHVAWDGLLKMLLESQCIQLAPANPRLWLMEDGNEHELLTRAKRHDQIFITNILREKTNEDKHEQYLAAVKGLKERITFLLSKGYHGARLDIYGSCLSDLSLGISSDVDLSLNLPYLATIKDRFRMGKVTASKYEREAKKAVYSVESILRGDVRKEFQDLMPVARARVPVVKGRYINAGNPHSVDGSIKFDICFFNDIAVANTRLLRDYTLVDANAKLCMLAIKAWARDYKVNSAVDDRISSYAWMNLVIFYLQCIGYLPNLQCSKLMKKSGFTPNPKGDPLHFVNALNTAFVPWNIVKENHAWEMPKDLKNLPLSILIHGFFYFYSSYFPRSLYATSIRSGEIAIPKTASRKAKLAFLCIEDPFETFNSHCPHDLGVPANEKGQEVIFNLIDENEAFLRRILFGKTCSVDGELWKNPHGTRPKSSIFNTDDLVKGIDTMMHEASENGSRQTPDRATEANQTKTEISEDTEQGKEAKMQKSNKSEDGSSQTSPGLVEQTENGVQTKEGNGKNTQRNIMPSNAAVGGKVGNMHKENGHESAKETRFIDFQSGNTALAKEKNGKKSQVTLPVIEMGVYMQNSSKSENESRKEFQSQGIHTENEMEMKGANRETTENSTVLSTVPFPERKADFQKSNNRQNFRSQNFNGGRGRRHEGGSKKLPNQGNVRNWKSEGSDLDKERLGLTTEKFPNISSQHLPIPAVAGSRQSNECNSDNESKGGARTFPNLRNEEVTESSERMPTNRRRRARRSHIPKANESKTGTPTQSKDNT